MDEVHGNRLAAWHAMGEPASLTEEQLAFLRTAGQAHCRGKALMDAAQVTLTLWPNGITRFRLTPAPLTPDVGYDYGWYCAD